MNANICPSCGNSSRPGARFCSHCGTSFAGAVPSGPVYLQPGAVLEGRFRIVRRLGEGGFGAVYLSSDLRLRRDCVVKQMLLPDRSLFATTGAWQSEVKMLQSNFEREARSLIALNAPGHPNIPEIFDFFDDASGNYLVMKYIKGENLAEQMTRLAPSTLRQAQGTASSGQAALPWRDAVEMTIQVASALEYMHSRTNSTGKLVPVLHRDIKPANILVDENKRVWLVDFGLSKAQPVTTRLGTQGVTTAAGTPGYAPIEQWLQQAVPASDVYSLGATLHYLVTERDPRSVFTTFDLA
ncbi:MAG: serine/threonine-protein kinase, partial [Ardenticatenaceae bacterium]